MKQKQPNLNDALLKGHSVPEVLDIYMDMLKQHGTTESKSHATCLSAYKKTAIDNKHLSRVRTLFNKMFNHLCDKANFQFTLEARRKSLLSTENKILKNINNNESLDLIRDFLGFRIIIYGKKTESALTLECYRIMKILIEFFIENGYVLCDAEPPKDTTGFKPEEHPGIYIPKSTKVLSKYSYGVKDYISHPKEKGYQSLHAVFRDPNGNFFEVQIRTLKQHVYAESSSASHVLFKEKNYGKIKKENPIDFSKLDIPGFSVAPDGTFFDLAGLSKSLLIFHRHKTN